MSQHSMVDEAVSALLVEETGSAVGIGARSQICTATDFSLIMRVDFH